jgi:ABC-2 type transport system permease protein
MQGFHAIMNLCLMPMWFLSGALFPQNGAPEWMRVVMKLNPLTYGLAWLKHDLGLAGGLEVLPSAQLSMMVTLLFGLSFFLLSTWLTRQRQNQNIR